MIPINDITQWQKHAPWALQSQVEQDLALSRALDQRAKGRDLYDLWMAITQLGVDCKKILEVFKYYNDQQDIKISRAEYEKNLIDKEISQDFLTDAKHVLPARTPWDPEEAFQVVTDKLVKHLPGESWKGLDH